MLDLIPQLVINGLLSGFFYALMSVGLSTVWATTKIINIAHGVFTLLVSYIAVMAFHFLGFDPFISMFIMIPLMFLTGMIIFKFVLSFIYRSRLYEGLSLVVTFGITVVLQNILSAGFGPRPQGIPLSYFASVEIATIRVPNVKVLVAVLSIATTLLLYLIVNKSYFGKAVRAAWQDEMAAGLCGVNTQHLRMVTFGLALSTTALAGAYIPVLYVVYPQIHWLYVVYMFVIIIVGGVGSVPGTLVAGLIVGLIEAFGAAIFPTSWVPIILYALLILLLFARPEGLFKGYA